MKTTTYDETKYKLVPLEPTGEMIKCGEMWDDGFAGAWHRAVHAAPAAEEAPQQEPDWTNSETLPTELWKNTRYSLAFRLKVADGAVAFERRVVENLRSQLKQQPATHGEPVAWRMRNTAYSGLHYEYYTSKESAEQRQTDFNRSVDDGGLHDLTPLYLEPQPTPEHIKAMKQALKALEAALSDDQPYIAQSKEAVTALQNALKGTT